MPTFKYQAVDLQGVSQTGEMDSTTRVAALGSLQRRGLTPVSLQELRIDGRESIVQRIRSLRARHGDSISPRELVTVTESLAALMRAGMTVDRAIAITSRLGATPSTRNFLDSVGRLVRSGRSLTDSLMLVKQSLPAYYLGMIAAGEAGGSLAQTMSRLAELLRNQHQVRERIRSALTYPALLAGVVLLTVVLLLVFVLPRFETLFAESQAPLPWATRAVLALGNFIPDFWWLLLTIGAVIPIGTLLWIRSPNGRDRVDGWLLNSRLTFGLPAAIDTARLLRTLSTLLANGVPIESSLRIGRATLTNTRLRRGLDEAAQRIKAGESTSAALDAAAVFPPHAVQLARVGEETGRLEELLLEAAVILEADSAVRLERLLTLLVPLLTICMGGIIAGLIGAVLVGLLSVNELAY